MNAFFLYYGQSVYSAPDPLEGTFRGAVRDFLSGGAIFGIPNWLVLLVVGFCVVVFGGLAILDHIGFFDDHVWVRYVLCAIPGLVFF